MSSYRANLKGAVGSIEPGKPRYINKTSAPVFVAPSEIPTSEPNEGELPPGKRPGGEEPEGKNPPGDSPVDTVVSEREAEGDSLAVRMGTSKLRHQADRRRERTVRVALQQNESLSQDVQKQLIGDFLSQGWGRCAHGLTRVLKCPRRYGFKLVDVALASTVFDKTIALVSPVAFAPISAEDFREETQMDDSNIRVALNSLVSRGVLIKIKTGLINFWGLNPQFFNGTIEGQLPPGHLPGGKKHGGNAPGVKPGKSPGGKAGQNTGGQSPQTTGNCGENSNAKNLPQESKKESSLRGAEFPDDMKSRWSLLESSGQGFRAKNEREIFQELFLAHGRPFFENCGRVVAFLDQNGTGKEGTEGKIHSPLVWLRGHWEINFARYENFLRKERELAEAHAARLAEEARVNAQQDAAKAAQTQQEEEDRRYEELMAEATDRFLTLYPTESDVAEFVENLLQEKGGGCIRERWQSNGWNSPMVRGFVISRFLKLEASGQIGSLGNIDQSIATSA